MEFHNLYSILFENAASRSYSCLMLDLGFLQKDIEKLQEKICPCDIKEGDGLGLEDEFHCTILYGIHQSKPYDVISKLDLKPAKFILSGISLFKNDKYDVLKFDIKSKDLVALNKQVREKCSYTSDYPEYHAHATISYLEKGAGKYYKNLKSNLIGKEFTSNKYIFSNPQGEKVFHKCK